MQDINSTKKFKKKVQYFIFFFIVICFVLSLFAFLNWEQTRTTLKKTEEIETLLTEEHMAEAKKAVQHFEASWMGLEMHKNPKYYYEELITGPLLRSYINQLNFQSENVWLIPFQTDIMDIRVVEYDDQNMKVIACLDQRIKGVDHSGTAIEEYPLRRIIMFYVFVKDGESWKVGNFLDITDPKQALQDWDFMPKDLKDITGDISSIVYKKCQIEK